MCRIKSGAKRNFISEKPQIILASNDKLWKGFYFNEVLLSESGFMDTERPLFNIEQICGPIKFRSPNDRFFNSVAIYPRIHHKGDAVLGTWEGSQRGMQLFIEHNTIETLIHRSFRIDDFERDKDLGPVVQNLLQALWLDVSNKQIGGGILGTTILTAILHEIAPHRDTANIRFSARDFKRLTDWIEDHLAISFNLEDLANEAHCSVRQLSRIFLMQTNFSPYKYILLRRVERAKNLLENSQSSLTDIAIASGFANQAHMADTFRKILGAKPSHFSNNKRRSSAKKLTVAESKKVAER